MQKISLCMIIKNEEKVLDRCLKSAQNIVDEIIIVDTGSSDNSKKIAKKYTNKIYDFEWCDDFAKARNFSFSLASNEYIMWLDADDIIPKSSQRKILNLKENMSADTYMIKYKMLDKKNKVNLIFYRERIIKNCTLSNWQGVVHECITPFGKIEYLDCAIHHKKYKITNPNRNLEIYKNIVKNRELNTRELYYFARELYDHKKYRKSIQIFKEFLSNKNGWIENVIDAYYMIAQCYLILNKPNLALKNVTKLLNLVEPKPNICCLIGDILLTQSRYKLSTYWYILATKQKINTISGAFINPYFTTKYPYLQLCYCYYMLGDLTQSKQYNNKVLKIDKTNPIALNNKKFFDNL